MIDTMVLYLVYPRRTVLLDVGLPVGPFFIWRQDHLEWCFPFDLSLPSLRRIDWTRKCSLGLFLLSSSFETKWLTYSLYGSLQNDDKFPRLCIPIRSPIWCNYRREVLVFITIFPVSWLFAPTCSWLTLIKLRFCIVSFNYCKRVVISLYSTLSSL